MSTVVQLSDVSIRRGPKLAVQNLNLEISSGQHWAVLGANGAGKTSLMLLLSASLYPESGEAKILGETLGLTDINELRLYLGLSSQGQAGSFRDDELVLDVVRSAVWAMTGTWREEYTERDTNRALGLLADWGLADFAARKQITLSEGERKRMFLARALMNNPEILLLDEPTAGMDLAAREDLIQMIDQMAAHPGSPVTVLVTHHVEEIPACTTHILLLRNGHTVASGPIGETLTASNISTTLGIDVVLDRRDTSRGVRWSVTAL